jgi:hypothetical protein
VFRFTKASIWRGTGIVDWSKKDTGTRSHNNLF